MYIKFVLCEGNKQFGTVHITIVWPYFQACHHTANSRNLGPLTVNFTVTDTGRNKHFCCLLIKLYNTIGTLDIVTISRLTTKICYLVNIFFSNKHFLISKM